MGLWTKKVEPVTEDTRTEVLLERMDSFLVELQKVADRLVAKLEADGGDDQR